MPDALFGARAMKMYPSDFAAAVDRVRITLLAAPCHVRKTEMTDGLVELLIQLIHKISVRAERKVESEINAEQPQEPGDCCSPELLAQRSKYASARAISALQPPQRPPSSAQSPRRCHQPQGRRRCSPSAARGFGQGGDLGPPRSKHRKLPQPAPSASVQVSGYFVGFRPVLGDPTQDGA